MNGTDLIAVAPLLFIAGLALALIVIDIAFPRRDGLITGVAVVGIVAAMVLTVIVGPIMPGGALDSGQEAFGGAYVRDQLTAFLDLLFLAVALLTVLFAPDYLRPRDLPLAEFAATLLFAITGAMLLAGARDLLILFLGLELLVLPGYMLAGYAKRDGFSTEGAIKYFLLGSFSSAIFLFGLALTFGLTGTTRIGLVAQQLQVAVGGQGSLSPALMMGLALLTTGVAFKIAAVPFHYWTPDAYQGSPTPVTGYLSVGPKVAAFALVLRLFVEALGPVKLEWTPFIVVLAAATMTLGNLVALTQDNIKRMLAYSSIAHTGYILVGLAAYAGTNDPAVERAGLEGVLFYSFAYAFMNLGAFAVVAALQHRPGVTSQISSFAGLGRRAPLLGILMALFLLSLTGIPPTAGFFAKAYVILAAVQAGGVVTLLAVITMLNAAASAFYYLRVIVFMYMREAPANAQPVRPGRMTQAGLGITAFVTMFVMLFLNPTIDFARHAAAALLPAL